ncbi:MAG: PEP-CTERM-box response regulator transcription factor [candidate division Zixibacteria bacterium]|nr:PEP-CTERM-box response regulator transcription factor [candidate division Zixibacteria bacterium]
MEKEKILIVDDEEGIRTQLSWALQDEYEILLASNAERALELARKETPDLVTLDVALSPYEYEKDGLDILDDLLQIDPLLKVIVITGHGEEENALRAVSSGACDFYTKPIDLDELKVIIKRALHIQRLERENKELVEKLEEKKFEDIIGTSPKMIEVFKTIMKIATTDVTVLITGESGTGKEMVAKAIHRKSLRRDNPFVTINCGAIPETLLESELFGHEKGAFTDAYAQKKGKFEYADGGTVFLDEIGELPLSLQVKLLRFLQDYKIERVGGKELIALNVRIIAATNKPLEKEVQLKKFREDLYYRLSVINIPLPPLRDRDDDVIILSNAMLNMFSKEFNKINLSFSHKSILKLKEYGWPGNVRELENKIKRAVIMCQSKRITPFDLGFSTTEESKKPLSLQTIRENTEKEAILEALNACDWNVSNAAKYLDVSRTTLYGLIEKYKFKKEEEI